MRKLLVTLTVGLLAVGLAGSAYAARVQILTSTGTKLGFGKVTITTGEGVATLDNSFGGEHLMTMRIAPTDPVNGDPAPVTDPEVTPTVVSNIVATATGKGGTFAPISGGGPLTQNTLAIGGLAKVCLIFTDCSSFLPLPLTGTSGGVVTRGVGVGGTVTVGGAGDIRVSLINSPWQLSTATRLVSTQNGVVITRMHAGFIHGPMSNTSSTAKPSGVIQLITPIQVYTSGIAGNTAKISLFTSLTVHFVPEPGLLLLIGSGVVGLALVGRSRMRK
jgi:hypothetical protein